MQKKCDGSAFYLSGGEARSLEDFVGAGALMESSASSQIQRGPQSFGPAADGAAGGWGTGLFDPGRDAGPIVYARESENWKLFSFFI